MEYVWITGPSAIGKCTLAHLLADAGSSGLRQRLNIAEPVRLLRYANSLQQLTDLGEAETGLIIWQHAADHFIDELAAAKPDAVHRIILVWRPVVHHLPGYKTKTLPRKWKGFTEETSDEKWLNAMRGDRKANFKKVQEHVNREITIVDASNEYAILPELPPDD